MHAKNLYRTFLIVGLGILGLTFTGCEQARKEHKVWVEKESQQWNLTRLGIMYDQALQQYKTGDYDKCRETLKDALAVKTPFAPLHVLAAKVDLEGGSLEDASNHLKEAIHISGADPEPYYLLGVVYQRFQQFDTAADYYQQAMTKKPTEASYVIAAAEMKISAGHLDDARQVLEDKIMYFEQSAAMRVALAKIAGLQNDPAAAAKYLRDATLLVPDNVNVRWSYAQALFDAHKYADAAKILEDLRKDPPTLPKAKDALTKGNDQQIDEQSVKSTKASLLIMLGQAYVSLNRPMDARDCFQELIRLQPENMSAYISLGKSCLMTNELTLSLAASKKVLRTEPNNVEALVLQAAVQQKQKKWSEAAETLAIAAKVAPKDMTVLCMQGLSELQLGKKEVAVSYFEKAVAVNPTDSWANALLARVKPIAASAPVLPTLTNAEAANPVLTPETPGANSVSKPEEKGTDTINNGTPAGSGKIDGQ